MDHRVGPFQLRSVRQGVANFPLRRRHSDPHAVDGIAEDERAIGRIGDIHPDFRLTWGKPLFPVAEFRDFNTYPEVLVDLAQSGVPENNIQIAVPRLHPVKFQPWNLSRRLHEERPREDAWLGAIEEGGCFYLPKLTPDAQGFTPLG